MKMSDSALWVIVTSAKLTAMTGSIIVPVINLMRNTFDVDPASAGLIVTTHALFAALFYPYFKGIVRRTGIRNSLVMGLLLYGVAGGSGLFITSYGMLLVTRALLGIGLAAVYNSVTAVLNLYTEEERKDLMGLRGASTGFGAVNWPIAGGILGMFSWHLPFAIYFFAVVLGVLTWTVVPHIEKIKDEPRTEPSHGDVVHLPHGSTRLAVYSFTVLENIFVFTILVFIPQILEKMGIVYPLFYGFIILIIMFSAGLGSYFYEKLRQQLTRPMIIMIVLLLWAAGFFAIFKGSGLIIAASLVIFGIGQGVLDPVLADFALGITIPSRENVNTNLRVFGFLGQFLAPVIFFPVVYLSGLPVIFCAAGAICCVIFFVFLIMENLLIDRKKPTHEYV